MSLHTKYLILRVDDMRRMLSPEQRQALLAMVQAIDAGRQAEGKGDGPLFALNPQMDACAIHALEAYIDACEASDDAHAPGRQAAAQAARDVRLRAIMGGHATRTPD